MYELARLTTIGVRRLVHELAWSTTVGVRRLVHELARLTTTGVRRLVHELTRSTTIGVRQLVHERARLTTTGVRAASRVSFVVNEREFVKWAPAHLSALLRRRSRPHNGSYVLHMSTARPLRALVTRSLSPIVFFAGCPAACAAIYGSHV